MQRSHNHLGNLFYLYNSSEKEQLSLIAKPSEDDRILFTLPNLSPKYNLQTNDKDPPAILPQTKYLVAEFLCEPNCFQSLDLKILYKSNFQRDPLNRSMDFTQTKTIALHNTSNAKAKLFFPAYFTTRSRFEGIEISKVQARCIAGIYKIKDISQFPLLLTLVFPPEWEKIKRYQISVE